MSLPYLTTRQCAEIVGSDTRYIRDDGYDRGER